MIRGLSEGMKFKVLRPLYEGYSTDSHHMPVIKKTDRSLLDCTAPKVISIMKSRPVDNLSNHILLGFDYDHKLDRVWRNPEAYFGPAQRAMAVCTPDFSAYEGMSYLELEHNIFKSRWLGCYYQFFGCTVIPTVTWAGPDTYDICFSGLEPGGVVAVSTLGCCSNTDAFLAGYREMMKRLKPSLVVVFGKFISGLYGSILHFNYNDSFTTSKKAVQLELFEFPRVIDIGEVK